MPRIAVTGHMNLTPETKSLVYTAVVKKLNEYNSSELIGISCLARGADSIFAQAVLDTGGSLEVVLPSLNYRLAKVKPDHAQQFDDLLGRATMVRTMPFDDANRIAYEAANEELLSSCDQLIAVWDGQGALDRGGTAAAVADAQARGLPVSIIWPERAARDRPVRTGDLP